MSPRVLLAEQERWGKSTNVDSSQTCPSALGLAPSRSNYKSGKTHHNSGLPFLGRPDP